ncbi:MAG: ABC transporter permease [Vicinamibacteria bacterium]|nr:ABC transporter permease [Vicinamibacteria bacterium]
MLSTLVRQVATLVRYRALIQSLVSRELKARYRGSLLGFVWSFVNPLLLLATYGLVFTYMLPVRRSPQTDPYFVFLFCGILPWTWFSSSLLEASGVLISSGNLIKKVLFPAEVLPVVTVLANLAHFGFGLPILLVVLLWSGHLSPTALLMVAPLLVQLLLTLGLALFISALTVHFRDIGNILGHVLHLWFFSTPVLYAYDDVPALQPLLRLNPMTHVMIGYQEALFFGHFVHWRGLLAAFLVALFAFAAGAWLFERLRDTLAEEV